MNEVVLLGGLSDSCKVVAGMGLNGEAVNREDCTWSKACTKPEMYNTKMCRRYRLLSE